MVVIESCVPGVLFITRTITNGMNIEYGVK